MKRGWITWDHAELPPEAFAARLDLARKHIARRDLPALAVYTDNWRSNDGRFFSNFMPYFNRALLVIPGEGSPVLLCGLSPRVYPWIRSVTILDEIRSSPNLPQKFLELCSEKGWAKIGVMDLPALPRELHAPLSGGPVELVDVARGAVRRSPDAWELAMYRRAAALARQALAEELPHAGGMPGHAFAGRLEARLRRAGAEDVILLMSDGETAPAPARGAALGKDSSVALALEYRGHWVKVARPLEDARPSNRDTPAFLENLAGPYPYEPGPGPLFASHFVLRRGGKRLFYSDTYHHVKDGAELL
ncbi:MAG TPA: hypothetical protein VJ732_13010 [Bryobacteraceae bacterium]|nr:hypothetical protein [Bryobacteraceae bacterium]